MVVIIKHSYCTYTNEPKEHEKGNTAEEAFPPLLAVVNAMQPGFASSPIFHQKIKFFPLYRPGTAYKRKLHAAPINILLWSNY